MNYNLQNMNLRKWELAVMEFTVSNLIILFSVFMIVSNINEAVEAEIQIPIVLECKNLFMDKDR